MGGLTDADHGAILRDSATIAFTDLFLDAGISQIHIAGDGFICAMVLKKPSEAIAGLKRFSAAYASYLARLEDLNSRITAYGAKNASDNGTPLLGSRLAVHYGSHRFGKMRQASSLVTSFDGSEIVRVSRLEQALRAVTKDPIEAKRLKSPSRFTRRRRAKSSSSWSRLRASFSTDCSRPEGGLTRPARSTTRRPGYCSALTEARDPRGL